MCMSTSTVKGSAVSHFFKVIFGATLGLLFFVPSVLAQSESTEPEAVALVFDWPVGLTAEISQVATREEIRDGRGDSAVVDVTYRLEAVEHPQGRLLRHSDRTMGPIQGLDSEASTVLQKLNAVMPGYVVSADGGLLAVSGLEEMKTAFGDLMDAWIDSVTTAESTTPEEAAEGRTLFENAMAMALSEEVLFAGAQKEWHPLVGFWAGAELEVGSAYVMEGEGALPLPGSPVIPYVTEFGVAGWVPCTEAEEEARCVELVLYTFPDLEAAGDALTEFLDGLAGTTGQDSEELNFDGIDVWTEHRLITEPGTLIPYSMTAIENSILSVVVDGESQPSGRYQREEYQFRYIDRGASTPSQAH